MKKKKAPINRKSIANKVVGVGFILIGLTGLALPILPGWILIFVGVSVFSDDYAKRLKEALRRFRYHKSLFKLIKEVLEGTYLTFIKKVPYEPPKYKY